MTKQQFMAFSFPYGLKCIVNNQFGDKEIVEIDTISNEIIGGAGRYFNKYKSILYPLSDYEKFGLDISDEIAIIELIDNVNIIDNVRFGLILNLISWHFDIAGLIEKGEAIDVNTFEINPYK